MSSSAMLNSSLLVKTLTEVQLITWTWCTYTHLLKSYIAKRKKKRMIHQREGNFYSRKITQTCEISTILSKINSINCPKLVSILDTETSVQIHDFKIEVTSVTPYTKRL